MSPGRTPATRTSPRKRRHFTPSPSPDFHILITSPKKKKKPVVRSDSEDELAESLSEINLQPSPTVSEYEEDVTLTVVDESASNPDTDIDDVFGTLLKPQRTTLSPEVDDPLPATSHNSHNSVPQSPVTYDVADDELIEDENLQVFGETDPDDWSDNSDSDTGSEVPVRLLKDFVLYDIVTNEVVPIASLTQIGYSTTAHYGCSGTVEVWIDHDDDDEDDEDDDEAIRAESEDNDMPIQRVKLSRIIEFDVHHFSRYSRRLDSKIYIRTEFAWYILDTPSDLYSPFFSSFWIQHRIFHLIVTQSLENPRLTYEAFIASLEITPETSDSVAIAIKVIGRELTELDVQSDDVNSYVLSTLRDLRDQHNIRLDRVPLVRTIRGVDLDGYVESSDSKPVVRQRTVRASDLEMDVLRHKNQTVVTPRIGRIAQGLFELTLRVAGQSSAEDNDIDDDDLVQAINQAKIHHQDPISVKWVEPADSAGHYNSVIMDGVVYSIGDIVMVNPGADDDHIRANNALTEGAQTKNSLGNRLWFCLIWYFFQKRGQKYFHGQWFAHGSKTLLQETAHPQSLFLMNSCDDIPLASVFQKCQFRWLHPDDEEPPESDQENNFHCGLIWNEEESSFTDLPTEIEIAWAVAACPEGEPCVPCGLSAQEGMKARLRPLPGGGFSQFGQNYHPGDFVYVKPNAGDGRYEIAQIMKVKAMEIPALITVTYFERYDSKWQRSELPDDERRLFKTSRSLQIGSDDIDGVCYVSYLTDSQAIDEWVQHDDHYFVNQYSTSSGKLRPLDPDDFYQCKICWDKRIEILRVNEELLARHQPLRGMELFCGAGGLGTGLDMSGFVETRVAIEFSPSAAKTYAANHPHTKVFNQCTNLLLQHAIDCHEGKQPPPLSSLHDGKTRLEAMPKPGEVDFIYGGPPCQSFSGANRWKKANDIRSTLVCNMLSYVEFYQPSYFQLENVTGLLQFPLNGRQVERTIVDGIKMGVVKFIERSLIALGYQVRSKVLQAGQYGAPQGRRRVIFWGARRGTLLPEFPIPTHSFKGAFFYQLPTGSALPPVTRSKDPEQNHSAAPLGPVTVNDAIGDLPPFDWKCPYEECPATARDKAEVVSRAEKLGIPAFEAVRKRSSSSEAYSGYTKHTPYAHLPQNRYQMWVRKEAEDEVQYQYTRRFVASVVERVWNIPFRGNADHRDLPFKLRPRRFDGKKVVGKGNAIYGRIDGEGVFRTAMTTVAPNAKASRVIHPSQKRILTVRECARAQGFPDNYQFLSVNNQPYRIVQDQHRQIGNAVPVPLSLALGKSLGESLLKMWATEERDGSPEV